MNFRVYQGSLVNFVYLLDSEKNIVQKISKNREKNFEANQAKK